jgi:hypothetical protein
MAKRSAHTKQGVKDVVKSSQARVSGGGPHTPRAKAPAKPSGNSASKNGYYTDNAHPGAATGPRSNGTHSKNPTKNIGTHSAYKSLAKNPSKKAHGATGPHYKNRGM